MQKPFNAVESKEKIGFRRERAKGPRKQMRSINDIYAIREAYKKRTEWLAHNYANL